MLTQVGAAEHRYNDILEAVLQIADIFAHAVKIDVGA